ncbi:hypothetical protein BGW39_008795 [Mortierella sp. 14UC]|nr:hypothetical protein BGW39_008795 [Mortierella sp. 14UC]
MNSFTIETVLETREPGVIELPGDASGDAHKVSGTLHLHVDKAVHLKELSVVFLYEAVVGYNTAFVSTSSQPVPMYKNQFDAIPTTSTPTEFLPGAYTFPFQIAIPSDLSATDSTKLISQEFSWAYHLTTTAVLASVAKGITFTSLFQKRKTIQQPLTLRRVVLDPSRGSSSVRSNAGRKGERVEDGEFKAAIFVPQVVNIKQTIVPVTVQLMALGGRGRDEKKKSEFWVKEIQAQAIQTEKIMHTSTEVYQSMAGMRSKYPLGIVNDPMATKKYKKPAKQYLQQLPSMDNPDATFTRGSTGQAAMINAVHTKLISNLVTITDPNQFLEGIHTYPEEYSQTFELDLTAGTRNGNGGKEALPSERLSWMEISHAIKLRVVFEDELGQKPLVVKVPLKIAFVCQRESIHSALEVSTLQASTGSVGAGDGWMYGESAPEYEFGAGDVQGGGGRGEDVLPGYGEDVRRSSLLDSNVQGLLVK